MSFLSGLESVLGKIFTEIKTVTTVAVAVEPGLELIPGYGPAIVAGIQAVVGLESLFPSLGSGTPANNVQNAAKSALAVPVIVAAQPTITPAQAAAILAAIVTGFNNASAAAAALQTVTSVPAAPATA